MLDIERIEKKYNLSQLKFKNFYIWGYLRGVYGSYTLYKQRGAIDNNGKNSFADTKINRLKKYIKNLFYGFKNWFKKYDYIVFSDTDTLKEINGKYRDRLSHKVMLEFGVEKFLYIETSNKKSYYPLNKCDYYKVSDAFVFFISRLLFMFLKFKIKYKNELLDTINKEFDLKIDYQKEVIKFYSEYIMYQILFKIYKPKIIFVTCFTKRAIVKAANDLNILTVEFQHGGIENNYAYNSPLKNDYSFQSKVLCVYGYNDKKLFNKYNYIQNNDNIFVTGNYYLEYVSNLNTSQISELKKYKKTVAVSLQSTVAKEMISFVEGIADELNDIAFILIPRIESDLKYLKKKKENIFIFKQYNCYELVKLADIHLSAYSTCLLEAPIFGVLNLFYNIKGNSVYYFKDYIESKFYNYLINDKNDFVKVIKSISRIDKIKIQLAHSDYIAVKENEFEQFIKYLKGYINES